MNWLVCYEPDSTHTAVIPRGSEIFVGEISESGNWNKEEDEKVAGDILKWCAAWVGPKLWEDGPA